VDVKFVIECVLSHCWLGLFKPDLLLVFFQPGLNRLASLFNVDLTTFIGYAVYAWSLQSQVILNRWPSRAADQHVLILCLDHILLMWLKVVWIYSRKVTDCLLAGSGSPH
jgi:hypothetical protein